MLPTQPKPTPPMLKSQTASIRTRRGGGERMHGGELFWDGGPSMRTPCVRHCRGQPWCSPVFRQRIKTLASVLHAASKLRISEWHFGHARQPGSTQKAEINCPVLTN